MSDQLHFGTLMPSVGGVHFIRYIFGAKFMESIRTRKVLQVILLNILKDYPEGLKINTVYDYVNENHTFPNEWYREIPSGNGYDELKKLGYGNWNEIPQDLLITLVETEPQWQNEMRWARNDLRESGHIDNTAPRGIWRLTPLGQASDNIETNLEPQEVEIIEGKKPKQDENKRVFLEKQLEFLSRKLNNKNIELAIDIIKSILKNQAK